MARANFSDMSIIIPTLDEAGNIGRLIKELIGLYKGCRIIVADDGSTDGTKEIVRKMGERGGNVSLLDRSNSAIHGLTASVIDASSHVGTSKIVVMDGDLQHPASKVLELYQGLDKYDMAIGVRTEVRDWGAYRTIISKGMAYLAFFVFKLRGKAVCNDLMSGFFGMRTKVLKKIIKDNRNGFVYTGYKILLDVLRLSGNSVSRCEIPYPTFHKRVAGKSKLEAKQMADVLISIFK